MNYDTLLNAAKDGWGHMTVPGALHVVSTPIGNLGDITLRSLATLAHATLVCCEDTRTTRQLLSHFGIKARLMAVHEHNEAQSVAAVLEELAAGGKVALVSDAGTPLLSDPGTRLVARTIEAGYRVVPLPGASSLLAALVASGHATEPVTFYGFLPRKGAERTELLAKLATLPHTAVLFESPHRLVDTLRDLAQACAAAQSPGKDAATVSATTSTAAIPQPTPPVARVATVAREITKLHEDFHRGTLDDLIAYYIDTPPKGEIVIVLAGAPQVETAEDQLLEWAANLRAEGFRPREIVQRLMDEYGVARNTAYRLAHDV